MNPGRCERLFDGSITRTSPHARAARLEVRRFPKAMAAGSTPVSSAIPRGSASVDGGLSSRVETGALPVRGTTPSSPWRATGFQVRRTAFDSLARCQGDVQKAARLPCKQAHSERYRASPLRSRWRTSSPSAQTLNEVPVRDRRGLGRPRRKGESSRQEHFFAREVYPAARFASNEEDSDRSRARALTLAHKADW